MRKNRVYYFDSDMGCGLHIAPNLQQAQKEILCVVGTANFNSSPPSDKRGNRPGCCNAGLDTEMNRIYFSIPGKPKPQARHRTNKGRIYDPSAKLKADFALQSARSAPKSPISGPVLLYLVFYMPVPKGARVARKEAAIEMDHYGRCPSSVAKLSMNMFRHYHTKRPDSTNLQKLVEDALNGLFWIDDSQVQIMGAPKIYSHNPRTEVELFYE